MWRHIYSIGAVYSIPKIKKIPNRNFAQKSSENSTENLGKSEKNSDQKLNFAAEKNHRRYRRIKMSPANSTDSDDQQSD